jgi:hypothetical protein
MNGDHGGGRGQRERAQGAKFMAGTYLHDDFLRFDVY